MVINAVNMTKYGSINASIPSVPKALFVCLGWEPFPPALETEQFNSA